MSEAPGMHSEDFDGAPEIFGTGLSDVALSPSTRISGAHWATQVRIWVVTNRYPTWIAGKWTPGRKPAGGFLV